MAEQWDYHQFLSGLHKILEDSDSEQDPPPEAQPSLPQFQYTPGCFQHLIDNSDSSSSSEESLTSTQSYNPSQPPSVPPSHPHDDLNDTNDDLQGHLIHLSMLQLFSLLSLLLSNSPYRFTSSQSLMLGTSL